MFSSHRCWCRDGECRRCRARRSGKKGSNYGALCKCPYYCRRHWHRSEERK
ncbi:hypothetical protein EJB05_13475 [Eragrostis curvula]|uniref:Uncharacterized protein n=1 Tax=Eragrostis curvula TaxID=38414 RepID=A0A5J9VUZ4_9POAL|nr:hypothetical protein EJB05_13475 [Eragrostis curvula]